MAKSYRTKENAVTVCVYDDKTISLDVGKEQVLGRRVTMSRVYNRGRPFRGHVRKRDRKRKAKRRRKRKKKRKRRRKKRKRRKRKRKQKRKKRKRKRRKRKRKIKKKVKKKIKKLLGVAPGRKRREVSRPCRYANESFDSANYNHFAPFTRSKRRADRIYMIERKPQEPQFDDPLTVIKKIERGERRMRARKRKRKRRKKKLKKRKKSKRKKRKRKKRKREKRKRKKRKRRKKKRRKKNKRKNEKRRRKARKRRKQRRRRQRWKKKGMKVNGAKSHQNVHCYKLANFVKLTSGNLKALQKVVRIIHTRSMAISVVKGGLPGAPRALHVRRRMHFRYY